MEAAIRRILSSHFFEGALLIVFGLIMLLFPAPSITVIGIITGAVLLILGATLTVFYIINSKARHTLELFAGLICLAFGFEFVFHTNDMEVAMHTILSITLIYTAILLSLQAFDLRYSRGPLFVVTIVFTVIAAAFALVMLLQPHESEDTATRIKGASMVVEGLASLFVIKSSHIHTRSGDAE